MEEPISKIPPHSEEAEQAVIGACLLSPDAIAYALENKESDVYKAMKQALPRLTQKEWYAFTRLITLICCDLEKGTD